MVRTPQSEDRSDVAVFAPIERPRLVGRLAASAEYPIALLIAPAGYGKSVVLRQYLGTLTDATVRFTLRPEHSTLLGFLRGLTEALGEGAPHAITALAGAYDRNTASPKRATELARWMHAHLESFSGVIAIDDLHLADADPEVARFLTALIERTKSSIRWILASRSTAELPVGTWLAYRDADLPVDEHDLRFTLDEARAAADRLGLTIRDEELADLLALTEGWPAALGFALRTSTRSSELRSVSAMTREMIYRLLAEQVYATLDEEERGLLQLAAALPVIDVHVLERAGFDRALTIVERLRERTAFIYEESTGIYQCHELFREFLRHEGALRGKRSQQTIHERAARALEANGDIEHAIASYIAAASFDDVVRLLEGHGFDLLERARADFVGHAIESLDERARRQNASILGLQGALQASAGKFARAESLFRRALSRATDDRDLVATVSLRLASLMANQGQDVVPVLGPVASDVAQRPAYRAEALSLIAARQAISGDLSAAAATAESVEHLFPELDIDARRARILQHLGIVSRHVGNVKLAFERLIESSELATEEHFYGVASRTYAVLSNLAIHEEDDAEHQLRYAQSAAEAATKAGDTFALQTGLLQMLSAHMRSANVEQIAVIEKRLATFQVEAFVHRYVTAFRAVRLAWEGRFADAHALLSGPWKELHGIDRVVSGAQYALFLALDGLREASIKQTSEISTLLSKTRVSGRSDARSGATSQVFCALAELANSRLTMSDRILRRLAAGDVVEKATAGAAKCALRAARSKESADWDEATKNIEHLASLGYADVARLLGAVVRELQRRWETRPGSVTLTESERDILRELSEGLLPKEIAAERHRSIYTVRAHIANAISKLECHGRFEAVRKARQRGLI